MLPYYVYSTWNKNEEYNTQLVYYNSRHTRYDSGEISQLQKLASQLTFKWNKQEHIFIIIKIIIIIIIIIFCIEIQQLLISQH